MVFNRKSVLCFGRDRLLLETRQQLLERAGYATHSTAEECVVRKCLLNGDVGVLILCNALTSKEVDEITRFHREVQSTALILCLTIESWKHAQDDWEVYDTHDGPRAFIAAVDKLYAASNVSA